MVDGRLLSDAVDTDLDGVPDTQRFDHGPAAPAIEHERHGDEGLQRVALLTSGRTDIRLAGRNPDAEVEHVLDHVGGQAGTVVLDGDPALVDRDRDHRRDAGLLGGVDRVVEQFLQDHDRPRIAIVADLGDQLLLRGEIEETAGTKGRALKRGDHCGSAGVRLPVSTRVAGKVEEGPGSGVLGGVVGF